MTLPRRKKRLFSAWQIELTTRCPLSCRMCLRSERDDWQLQEMSFENFRNIVPYLGDVETVVLEGWGESLLYPNLLECIQLAKGEGSRVGFVTSGKGLTRKGASALVAAGLDFIGFSIAGTTEETHNAIRVNSRLPEIVDAVRFIREEKGRLGRTQPRVHLVFLMVKDNVSEVPGIPSFAREIGVEQVVLVNICHVGTAWQECQRVFTQGRQGNPSQKALKQAEKNARRLRVNLSSPSLSAADTPLCAENPLKNLYIASDGSVSPCVYLYPPLPSPLKRIFCSDPHTIEKVRFGNIFEERFPDIWNSEGYIRFRNRFIERGKRFRDLYFSLLGDAHPFDPAANLLPDPPECCRSCHKIIGV